MGVKSIFPPSLAGLSYKSWLLPLFASAYPPGFHMSYLQRHEVTIPQVGGSPGEVQPPVVPAAIASCSQTARAHILDLCLQNPRQVIQLLIICEMKDTNMPSQRAAVKTKRNWHSFPFSRLPSLLG